MEKEKKLRVVVLYSAGHLGSSVALNLFSKMSEVNIVGIVRGDPAPLNKKGIIKSLIRTKKLGLKFGILLVWQRFIQYLIFYYIAPLINSKHIKSGWQISKKLGIPSFTTEKVNSPATQNFITTLNPDIIVSLYFNQILKENILNIPTIGSINLHPGILPEYKGAYVYFWALRNHEKETGITLHWMDEGVDTGKIIAKKKFLIADSDTQQQIVVKSAICGCRQLQYALRKIANKQNLDEETNDISEKNYYKFPEKYDFKEYSKKRSFFRTKNIFYFIIRRPVSKLISIKIKRRIKIIKKRKNENN